MSEREIPAEAVEAAAKRIAGHYGSGANNWEWYLTEAAEILESAAPHLMAQAWDEGLEWGAAGEYIPPSEYTANPYRK